MNARIGSFESGWLLLIIVGVLGCGSKDSPPPATRDSNQTTSTGVESGGISATGTPASTPLKVERHPTPDQTVVQFLTALKAGDQPRATSMLTTAAQRAMAESSAVIQPPGSSSAQFEVTETELLGEQQDGAHVLSTWTDTEADGTPSTHEIVWILRREPTGWAIAGFGTRVFADQPPLILNFEDPLDLQRKRAAVDEEIARRNEPQQVRQAELPAETLTR
jgi:hypothetical protein